MPASKSIVVNVNGRPPSPSRMTEVISRPFRAEDCTACLAVFDSNVPDFFAQNERTDFRHFLSTVDTTESLYLVLLFEGAVVACGGLIVGTAAKQVRLAWGMVHRDFHRKGLGTTLMTHRLHQARSLPGIVTVALSTSQHTSAFYESFGFAVSATTPNGHGPGLDCVEMSLRLK